MLYISEYFDAHRDNYVHLLHSITSEGNWEDWIVFFLQAINVQAKKNAEKANQVRDLYAEMKETISNSTNSPNGIKVLDALFQSPIFRSTDFRKRTGLNHQTAYRLITILKDEKILSTIQEPSGRNPEILVFERLFGLINN